MGLVGPPPPGRSGRPHAPAAAPLSANVAASQHHADLNDAAPPPLYQQLAGVAVGGGSAGYGNAGSPTWALPSAPMAAGGVVEVRPSHAHTGTPTWALPAGSVSGGK
jgi:hypothetical protein